jgi:hypothetical protein
VRLKGIVTSVRREGEGLKVSVDVHDERLGVVYESQVEVKYSDVAARTYHVGREVVVRLDPK